MVVPRKGKKKGEKEIEKRENIEGGKEAGK
jgi:hypothetical protein